ncbi:hypothetical protein [Streptomyces sp. NPDC056987]|uniref:hypothetical protein n=1 Tax=Streptomyces sp. NPDC056987 TaxID=3345988 RepID=UPI00362D964D
MSRPPGAEVYRVDWTPGSDELHGTCHCGAERSGQDPVELWEWMLGHPTGHAAGHSPGAAEEDG